MTFQNSLILQSFSVQPVDAFVSFCVVLNYMILFVWEIL